MVNMLHLVKDMNHNINDEEQDETLKLWGIRCQDLGGNKRTPFIQNHDKILSNDDTNNSSIDEFQEDIEVTTENEQYRLFLKNQLTTTQDLNDNGFESFVQKEGPNQIMNLTLVERIKNVLFGETSDFDDYEDWIKCVEYDEHMKNVQFTSKKSSPVLTSFI